jgi:hypothetical protein
MNDEEKAELRAMLVDVIGAACNSLQEQLGSQIAEVHDEIGTLCDRADVSEKDMAAVRRSVARLQREREMDRRALGALSKRVADIEGEAK